MGLNCFKTLFGQDRADAVVAKAFVQYLWGLLFPTVVLPQPVAGRAFDVLLQLRQEVVHDADGLFFHGSGEIGPDGIGIANAVAALHAARMGIKNGAIGSIGEEGRRSRGPRSSAQKRKGIPAIGHPLISDDADKNAFFKRAKTLEDRVAGQHEAPSVFFADGDNPAVEPLVFDGLADGNPFHSARPIQKQSFPIRLMAAKENDPLPFGIESAGDFWIFALNRTRQVLVSVEFGVFEAIDGEILECLFGYADGFFWRKRKIGRECDVTERSFAVFA